MAHNWVPAARLAKKNRLFTSVGCGSHPATAIGFTFTATISSQILNLLVFIPAKALGRVTTITNPIMQPTVSKANANNGNEIIVMVGSHTLQKDRNIY